MQRTYCYRSPFSPCRRYSWWPIKFGPARVLQADTEIQPWPKRRAAVAEWQIGGIEDPTGAVRAPGKSAVERCVRSAANRNPPRRKAPGVVVDIRSRDVEAPQLIIGIVGKPQRLARARIMVLVDPSRPDGDCMRVAQILVLGIDTDVRERIVHRAGRAQRHNIRGEPEGAHFPPMVAKIRLDRNPPVRRNAADRALPRRIDPKDELRSGRHGTISPE